MTLYIANTTKQNWNHHFRLPEQTRPYFVQIPSGTQKKLGENWTADQTSRVIEKLERYGARNAAQVSGKLDRFPGLLYRTDRPITESEIVSGHDALVDAQERRSAEEATRSALAFDASNRDKKTRKRNAKLTQVEVVQDVPRNERPTGKEVQFDLSVSEDGSSRTKLPGV